APETEPEIEKDGSPARHNRGHGAGLGIRRELAIEVLQPVRLRSFGEFSLSDSESLFQFRAVHGFGQIKAHFLVAPLLILAFTGHYRVSPDVPLLKFTLEQHSHLARRGGNRRPGIRIPESHGCVPAVRIALDVSHLDPLQAAR